MAILGGYTTVELTNVHLSLANTDPVRPYGDVSFTCGCGRRGTDEASPNVSQCVNSQGTSLTNFSVSSHFPSGYTYTVNIGPKISYVW